jgi:hypothetical protein
MCYNPSFYRSVPIYFHYFQNLTQVFIYISVNKNMNKHVSIVS